MSRRRPGPPGGILFTPETAPWRPEGAPGSGSDQDSRSGSAQHRTPEPASRAVGRWCEELGVSFPVTSWQLVLMVDEFGGDLSATGAILRLDPGEYHSLADLLAALPPSAPASDARDGTTSPDAH